MFQSLGTINGKLFQRVIRGNNSVVKNCKINSYSYCLCSGLKDPYYSFIWECCTTQGYFLRYLTRRHVQRSQIIIRFFVGTDLASMLLGLSYLSLVLFNNRGLVCPCKHLRSDICQAHCEPCSVWGAFPNKSELAVISIFIVVRKLNLYMSCVYHCFTMFYNN